MKYLLCAFCLTFGALAVIFLFLGNEWITVGRGLHPILAGAAAMFYLGAPFVAVRVLEG